MQVQHQHDTASKQCGDTAKLLMILEYNPLSAQYVHGAAISKFHVGHHGTGITEHFMTNIKNPLGLRKRLYSIKECTYVHDRDGT